MTVFQKRQIENQVLKLWKSLPEGMSKPSDDLVANAIVSLSLHITLELLPKSRYPKDLKRELILKINRMLVDYDGAPIGDTTSNKESSS